MYAVPLKNTGGITSIVLLRSETNLGISRSEEYLQDHRIWTILISIDHKLLFSFCYVCERRTREVCGELRVLLNWVAVVRLSFFTTVHRES